MVAFKSLLAVLIEQLTSNGPGEASSRPLIPVPGPSPSPGDTPPPPAPGPWASVHLPSCPTGTAEQRDQGDAPDGGHGPGTPEGTHTDR